MSCPIKYRKISQKPTTEVFKPAGIPLEQLQKIQLTSDEFEAIRLADLEGLYQDQAGEQMSISRQTFGNILALAHRKIADALVNARALQVTGGTVTIAEKLFKCAFCQNQWPVSYENMLPSVCPACGNTAISPICSAVTAGLKKRCRKFCRRMNYESMHLGPGQ